MYLRRNIKKKNGADYDYWTLVESIRTVRGPRQRIVATIGKLPGLDREERIGWEEISRILSGKPRPAPGMFEQPEDPPSWATVNIQAVSVERLRSFGDVYVGLLLWNKLGLADFCREHIPSNREEVPWSIMAAILVLARFCTPSSELQIAEFWYGKTALEDILGVSADNITVTEIGKEKGSRLSIQMKKNEKRWQWALETCGSYILRTNWRESDPKTLWNTYIQLTEVEDSFRTEKHDLGMRPIYHHKQGRT
jgi:hypothetical protein